MYDSCDPEKNLGFDKRRKRFGRYTPDKTFKFDDQYETFVGYVRHPLPVSIGYMMQCHTCFTLSLIHLQDVNYLPVPSNVSTATKLINHAKDFLILGNH